MSAIKILYRIDVQSLALTNSNSNDDNIILSIVLGITIVQYIIIIHL